MLKKISRRITLKLIALGSAVGIVRNRASGVQAISGIEMHEVDTWSRTHDRVWLGAEVWANPMEDWRVVGGWAVCQNAGGNRSVHAVTRQITNTQGAVGMSVMLRRPGGTQDGGGGFRIGIKSDINEYRSNCFAGGGINAGVVGGELVLGRATAKLPHDAGSEIRLVVSGGPTSNDRVQLTLMATTKTGRKVASVRAKFPAAAVLGNVALVSQYDGPKERAKGKGYSFKNWLAGGNAFRVNESQAFGPILWSMYSLSDSRGDDGFVMKISALTGPMGPKDSHDVGLEVQRGGQWQSLGKARLDPDGWIATFRVPKWDQTRDTPFRLTYLQQHTDGSQSTHTRTGTIKANPSGRPLRLGALTCQNDYAFPYQPVAENLVKLDPDMLYFSGDQLYESHGGFGVIRSPAEPAILNYLRKFYQFGWAFGEAMRDRPTLCIPDDHDVFHGNIWGEGGAPMEKGRSTSSFGGYIQPARMVNVVHKTNCGHHPDFYDPKPVDQDISVYFGDMVYGNVSFAVLGDRQWKSAPGRARTDYTGRADHVADRDFDTSTLDKPGLVLLGDRQEAFLKHWSGDWAGHTMKVLLSQTVFAGVATHHGGPRGYLKADLDSGAWPQTARNRAIDIIRSSMALHINGDQHLTTMSQYGVSEQRDSNWSFCTPAIAAGYPRWWRPDEVGMPHESRPQHGHANTGEFLDGFGNKVYVYAVGNPEVASKKNRYERAHQKGSGFGLVTIDTTKKTYLIESFRFLVDPTDGKASNQFPGWPVIIQQKENRGENIVS